MFCFCNSSDATAKKSQEIQLFVGISTGLLLHRWRRDYFEKSRHLCKQKIAWSISRETKWRTQLKNNNDAIYVVCLLLFFIFFFHFLGMKNVLGGPWTRSIEVVHGPGSRFVLSFIEHHYSHLNFDNFQ